MKAGLFICDHVADTVRDQFGDYDKMFENLFPDLEFRHYDVINGQFPEDLDECEVYMATGSAHSVYENIEWINRLKATIVELKKLDKYFIGFCFGHQLIGEALGGSVKKAPAGWCVGVHTLEVVERTSWMNPFHPSFNILMMCQDQVVQLPPDSRVLASSKKCPVGLFTVGQKILGIQGHPEFSKEYDKWLMEIRMNNMGPEVAQNGIASIHHPVNSDIIRDWVLHFLKFEPIAI